MSLAIFKKASPAPKDERLVVTQDAAFQRAAKDFARSVAHFARYVNDSVIGPSAKETAELARNTLANRVMDLTDSSPSDAVSRTRLGAMKPIILQKIKDEGSQENEEELYTDVFAIFQDFAVDKAVERIRAARGEIAILYNREAQRLVAYGFYADDAKAIEHIREIHQKE